MAFPSRSQFLDHVMVESDVNRSKHNLSGSLAYRLLTGREFFGYHVTLKEPSAGNSRKRGNANRFSGFVNNDVTVRSIKR